MIGQPSTGAWSATWPTGADPRGYRAALQALIQMVNAADHARAELGAPIGAELEGQCAFARGVLGALADRDALPAELEDVARNACTPASARSINRA